MPAGMIREISINAFKNNKCVDAFLKRYRKEYETLDRYRVGTSDFTVVQVLGKGAFGEVSHVFLCAYRGQLLLEFDRYVF